MAKRSQQANKTNGTPSAGGPAASQPDKLTAPATDFIDDYYYVFTDMRFMIIVSVLIVVVGYGLSFIV